MSPSSTSSIEIILTATFLQSYYVLEGGLVPVLEPLDETSCLGNWPRTTWYNNVCDTEPSPALPLSSAY